MRVVTELAELAEHVQARAPRSQVRLR